MPTRDYSNINLRFSEKAKLFIMRFKNQVTEKFLGSSVKLLLDIRFIKSNYSFADTTRNKKSTPALYSLTDRYYRYCIFRRHKFFDSNIVLKNSSSSSDIPQNSKKPSRSWLPPFFSQDFIAYSLLNNLFASSWYLYIKQFVSTALTFMLFLYYL
mgnify:CR=1 FL=1